MQARVYTRTRAWGVGVLVGDIVICAFSSGAAARFFERNYDTFTVSGSGQWSRAGGNNLLLPAKASAVWNRCSLCDFVYILAQVFSGIAWLHHLGIMHRDVKPSNILLTASPTAFQQAVLADFGWAREVGPKVVEAPDHATVGATPGCISFPYRAPEVFLGLAYGAGVDVWSAGVILRELVTGRQLVGALEAQRPSTLHGLELCAALGGGEVSQATIPSCWVAPGWTGDFRAFRAASILPFPDGLLEPQWMGLREVSEAALQLDASKRPDATVIHRRLANFLGADAGLMWVARGQGLSGAGGPPPIFN